MRVEIHPDRLPDKRVDIPPDRLLDMKTEIPPDRLANIRTGMPSDLAKSYEEEGREGIRMDCNKTDKPTITQD